MANKLTLLEKVHLGAHVVDQFLGYHYGSGMHDLRCFLVYRDNDNIAIHERTAEGLIKIK